MNFRQLQDKFRVSIGNPSVVDEPDSNASGTGLGDYVNDAYQELFDKFNHGRQKPRARFNTVDGTGKYELPNEVGAIYYVWDRTNKRKLVPLSMHQVAEIEFDNPDPATGKPEKYIHVDDFLQLEPIPDGVYNMEFQYRHIPDPLANDADVPNLPSPWHKGIVFLARWHYWLDRGDVPKSAAASDMFERWVIGKPVELEEEQMGDDTGIEIPQLGGTATAKVWWDNDS